MNAIDILGDQLDMHPAGAAVACFISKTLLARFESETGIDPEEISNLDGRGIDIYPLEIPGDYLLTVPRHLAERAPTRGGIES